MSFKTDKTIILVNNKFAKIYHVIYFLVSIFPLQLKCSLNPSEIYFVFMSQTFHLEHPQNTCIFVFTTIFEMVYIFNACYFEIVISKNITLRKQKCANISIIQRC